MSSRDNSYVVFRLAGEEYGLPVAQVSGIIRYEEPTPVPRAPKTVLGVVNLRGRVIPLVDLSMRFRGTPFDAGPLSRIIVAEGASGPVGIVVDTAKEVSQFDPDAIRPVPDAVLTVDTIRAFTGVAERPEGLVILLDLDEAVPRSEYAGATTTDEELTEGV